MSDHRQLAVDAAGPKCGRGARTVTWSSHVTAMQPMQKALTNIEKCTAKTHKRWLFIELR